MLAGVKTSSGSEPPACAGLDLTRHAPGCTVPPSGCLSSGWYSLPKGNFSPAPPLPSPLGGEVYPQMSGRCPNGQ